MPIMKREGKKVSREYRGRCGRYSNGRATGRKPNWPRVSVGRFRRKIGETRAAWASHLPLPWIAVRSVPYFAAAKATAMLSTQPCCQSNSC